MNYVRFLDSKKEHEMAVIVNLKAVLKACTFYRRKKQTVTRSEFTTTR